MNFFVKITENGTEKVPITDSYVIPGPEDEVMQTLMQHIAAQNPHHVNLQQLLLSQGTTALNGELAIGSTQPAEHILRILKDAIYIAFNGSLQQTAVSIDGFTHTTAEGYTVSADSGGISLSNGENTIRVLYNGTITGLAESELSHAAVTRGYVDTLALGLIPHPPVKAMIDFSLSPFSYTPQGSGVGKTITANSFGEFQFQELIYYVGDRIGLRFYGNQRRDAGIYVLTKLGSETEQWELTRAEDFDGSSQFEAKHADILFVQDGTFAKNMFIQTQKGTAPNGSLIIDTDFVQWEQFHKPQDLVFEQGLQMIGQHVSVKPDITTGESMIPVSVSSAGVGVQKASITAIAEAKKQEAQTYTDTQAQLVLQQSNAYAQQLSQENITYTDEQIQLLEAQIPTVPQSYPMMYPQFHLLNGAAIQNYSDYLYIENSHRSGNDSGLQSNNCIPFMMPKNGVFVSVRYYIGFVAVAGAYVENTQVSINFELRRISNVGSTHVHTFTALTQGLSDRIGSYGNFAPTPIQVGGATGGMHIPLTAGNLYAVKFIHNATGSPIIASAVRNVVLRLEVRVG